MVFNLLLIILFVACFASLMAGGLWSNTLMLVNVLTAALLATNYFEPFADFLEKQDSSLTYVWDFVAVWSIFGMAMIALRFATDYLSPVKVRFFMPVEKAGGILMAIWVSWVIVCFATMTFHTAPLARSFLGFLRDPDSKMLFGLAPDRMWLGWVHRESMGSLCRLGDMAPFDARGNFIFRYADRRSEFEKQLTLTKSGETDKKSLPGASP